MSVPRVAIVGRPNVGKSSLMNRLAGRRVSIVEPTPGVTRDRVTTEIEWGGRTIELMDTGGLGLVDEELLKKHIEAQIQVALQTSDLVLFVVDVKEGRVPGDEMVAQRLRKLGKPVILVGNKVESRWDEIAVHEWIRLGHGEALPVSALEGFGTSDLLDRVVAALPEANEAEAKDEVMLKFAVTGKRNAGKSTLINLLAREDRVIVSEIPGTTRDAVDVVFDYGERKLMAIDTAGIRKKKSAQDAIEFFSYTRSTLGIRRADVVVHMFDVSEEISQVDKKLAAYCLEHHKPVVLVGNKVDLAEELKLEKWDAYIKQQLKGMSHAPVSFISALQDTNVGETLDLLFELREQAQLRIPTPKLNEVLQEAKAKLSPKGRGRIPKLFYGTQIDTEPVTILIFVNEPKLFRGQYQRYLTNVLRDRFPCKEVPIQIVFRKREKVELEKL